MDLISPLLLVGSLGLFAHALFSLYLLLYSWEYPERLEASHGPREFAPASTGFSILLPARDEVGVIGATIRRICESDYPQDLLQLIVICHDEDLPTIAEVESVISEIGSRRVGLVTFGGTPINKPRALNVGLTAARHQMVAVFDAEDDVDPQLFNSVNTVVVKDGVKVVQAGVQLMNFRDRWWTVHNCLEYFFWFKSRLHFHARVGMIPLGGNTVFIERRLLGQIGGWDETCLTEDADLGLRLSTLGEPIRVIYDAQRVTREETPPNLAALVRQRTRWSQGFLHVLRKGSWLSLPSWPQRALAVYTFSYPIVQGPITLLWPLAIISGFVLKVPVVVALASFLPLYAMLFQMVLMVVGAYMFAREYGLHVPRLMPLSMVITFMPYQWVLGYSAARAAYRELQHDVDWEKTEHVGAHRRPVPAAPERHPPAPLPWPQKIPVHGMVAPGAPHALGGAPRAIYARQAATAVQPAGRPYQHLEPSFAASIRSTFDTRVVSSNAAAPRGSVRGNLVIAPHLCSGCGRISLRDVKFCRRCGSPMRRVLVSPSRIQPAQSPSSSQGSASASLTPIQVPRRSTAAPRKPILAPRRHLRATFASLILSLVAVLSLFDIILAQGAELPGPGVRPAAHGTAPAGLEAGSTMQAER